MIRALYSAGSGMNAQQMSIDNIANNLANANTAGFKARRTQFQDLLYQSFLQPGAAAGSQTTVPSGLQLGLGRAAGGQQHHFHARQFPADRQSAGRRDSGQGILPDPQGHRRSRLHARGSIPVGPRRQHGDRQRRSPGAADHDSAAGADHHHRRRRHGQLHAAGPNRLAGGGADSAREFHESRRT